MTSSSSTIPFAPVRACVRGQHCAPDVTVGRSISGAMALATIPVLIAAAILTTTAALRAPTSAAPKGGDPAATRANPLSSVAIIGLFALLWLLTGGVFFFFSLRSQGGAMIRNNVEAGAADAGGLQVKKP